MHFDGTLILLYFIEMLPGTVSSFTNRSIRGTPGKSVHFLFYEHLLLFFSNAAGNNSEGKCFMVFHYHVM